MKKSIRTLLAMCMVLCMAVSMCVPAFAAAVEEETTSTVEVSDSENGVMLYVASDGTIRAEAVEDGSDSNGGAESEGEPIPYLNPKDLVYVENKRIENTLTNLNYTVTPSRGRSLRVWLKSNGPITLQVLRRGTISLPTEYRQSFNSAIERDVETVSSCNGGTYIVQISSSQYITFSMLVYETGG